MIHITENLTVYDLLALVLLVSVAWNAGDAMVLEVWSRLSPNKPTNTNVHLDGPVPVKLVDQSGTTQESDKK